MSVEDAAGAAACIAPLGPNRGHASLVESGAALEGTLGLGEPGAAAEFTASPDAR